MNAHRAIQHLETRNGLSAGRSSLQRGAALVVSLLILVVVLLLGTSAAQTALQNEKASRNDRDRQIAFQAAEAAILDAERDIQQSPDAGRSRSHLFAQDNTAAFPAGCGTGIGNPYLGLCAPNEEGQNAAWLRADLLDHSDTAVSVPLGQFTGQFYPVGQGPLPARLPRYIIEAIAYNAPGESAESATRGHIYRITAIGFGMRDSTRVVLQAFYRKEGQ